MAESSVKHPRVVDEKQAPKTVNTKALYPKAQLQKRDSGYISPVTPGTTPDNTTSSKAKSLHLGVQTLRSVSSPSAFSDGSEYMQKLVQPQPLQSQLASGKNLKRQLSSPGALDTSQAEHFLHLGGSGVQYSQFNHQYPQRMMLGQQDQLQPLAPFNCDESSVLFLAYKCKELNPLAWSDCKHPYCVMVRNNIAHMRTCYAGSGECKRCQRFDNQMYRHAEECTLAVCPVDMCRNTKQQLQQEFGSLPYDHNNPLIPHPLQRRNSFGGSDQYYGNTNQSSLLFSFSQFESASISDDSPAARYIGARADEIVEKLDREEPLLPQEAPSAAPPTSLGRPASLLRSNTAPCEDYQLNVLSPIAESPPFGAPHLLGGDHSMQSLSLMSSYEQDGIFKQGSKTAPSMGGPNSLVVEEDDATVFPEQQIMHKFRDDYFTIGGDGHYFQFRDYNANDNQITGGFGSVRFAEDLSSKHLFAIKCNNRDDTSVIESIETEARLLSQLGPHINVIQMYGAVLDCQEHDFLPTRMYKLMMELSQHGNLAEMVVDPETKEAFPLERDQALFYFWQVLKGVDFLHKSNVLHLDIKGSNILVFDEGRTLKICDFGTAVNVDEVASKVGKNLGTLQFSAPEICRQQMPHFSSDMWSTMCVLVEMLTGQKPWERYSNCGNGLIFTIGHYSDEQMESGLIPPGVELDPDVIELMRLVFRAEGVKRVSARDLLLHPLIITAFNYEACFDEVLEDECAPVEEELAYASHASCAPASLTLSLNPQDHTHFPEDYGHLPADDAQLKRLSKDSGTGTDLEMSGHYGRMSSSGRNSDSGLDTPCTADKHILTSSIGKPMFAFPEENSAEIMDSDKDITKPILGPLLLPPRTPSEGNYRSLPNPDLHSDSVTQVQRSFSLSLPGSHSSSSPYPSPVPLGSNNGSLSKRQQQCPWSYSRLRHSNSAPVIGDDHRRRLSLQSLRSYRNDEYSSGKLRRISSEIYVDRGPDIDSPDRLRMLDVSTWAQTVQKELLVTQKPSHEQECDNLAPGHTPSEEDEPLVMRMRQPLNRNCNSSCNDCSAEVQGSQRGQKVDAQGFGVQMVDGNCPQEGVAGAEASKTEVKKHVTTQGRIFDVYKTVC